MKLKKWVKVAIGVLAGASIISVCGYVGVIKDVCPGCGRHENEGIEMEKISCLDCYGSCSSFTK